MVELLADAKTLLLPAERNDYFDALRSLKVMRLLGGFRGAAAADLESVLDVLTAIGRMAESLAERLLEMDINPLLVTSNGCVAADALIHIRP